MSTALDIVERLAPHSLEAERAVLGTIMLEGNLYDQAAAILSHEDFYLEAHRAIFKAFGYIADDDGGGAIDLNTIVDAIRTSAGSLEDVGGKAYLSTLVDGLPRYSNIERYCKIVREKAALRRCIDSGLELVNAAYADDGQSAIELVEKQYERLGAIAAKGGSVQLRSLADAYPSMYTDLEYLAEMMNYDDKTAVEKDKYALPCPYRDLAKFRPFLRGGMTIVAARPSMGKSMFALDLELRLARKYGLQCAHFSLEDLDRNVWRRFASNIKGEDLHSIYGKPTPLQFASISEAYDELQKLDNLSITTSVDFSQGQLYSMARDHHRRHGLDLMVVDYIQLFGTDGNKRYHEIGRIARRLRSLSEELNCCVLLVCQINREAAYTDKKGKPRRPSLTDLRESGDLEQITDVALLLHRESYYDPENPELGETQVLVAKNKNGRRGKAMVTMHGPSQRVTDLPYPGMEEMQ